MTFLIILIVFIDRYGVVISEQVIQVIIRDLVSLLLDIKEIIHTIVLFVIMDDSLVRRAEKVFCVDIIQFFADLLVLHLLWKFIEPCKVTGTPLPAG